jgi:hypothetical protein
VGIILNILSFRSNFSPSFDVMTDIWRIISTFFCFNKMSRWRVVVFIFKPHSFAISSLVKNPSGRGGATFVRIAVTKSSCQGFRGFISKRFYVCGEMELVASLPCLEYIVGLVGVNHSVSPAVLPS